MYFSPCLLLELLAKSVYSHLCNLSELNEGLEWISLKFHEHISLIFLSNLLK